MSDLQTSFFYIPGAGGGKADLISLSNSLGSAFDLKLIDYPGWQRYIAEGFSPESLLDELTAHLADSASDGPIRIASASLGGHFSYAAALRLEQMDRSVGGLLIIDSFMISSSGPSDGWQARAMAMALDLLRKGEVSKIARFLRSKFWRGIYRLAGGGLIAFLRSSASSGRLPWFLAIDPIAEEELSMRLLIRAVAPWIAALDVNPAPLHVPAILLRTELTARDDAAWLLRCPEMKIVEIQGDHLTMFQPENVGELSDAFARAAGELTQKDYVQH